MKKLFILNGSGCCGKDTFVDIVKDYFVEHEIYIPIQNISSVDKVKEAAMLLGWNGIKDDKSRKFLSDLKLLSSDAYNHSIEYMSSCVCESPDTSILFFHIREPEEIAKFVKLYPETKTILIERDVIHIPDNMADNGVSDYNYDYIIKNNGTLEEYKEMILLWMDKHLIDI